jgi:hypothetical protein
MQACVRVCVCERETGVAKRGVEVIGVTSFGAGEARARPS